MLDAITSDPLVNTVLWSTAGLAGLVTAILAWAGTLRLRQALHAEHESRFVARWRPLLLISVDAIPSHLPRVNQPDWFVFLILWNQFHDSIEGPARHRIKALALRLRMDSAARKLLETRNDDNRLVAVVTLGHLGDQDSWNIVEEIARSRKPLLSVTALRALFLIDASRATAVLLSSLGARSDWPTEQLKAIIAEADTPTVSEGLVQAAEIAIPSELPRLIALMDEADVAIVSKFLRRLLRMSRDEEALIACLKSRHVPKDLKLLTPFMKNSSWQVRTQVARALGGLVARGEENLLISMLSDEVWWVRFRAAQSLSRLPFYSRDELWRLRFLLTDRFAQDILDHVVAEKKMQ
jgi:HEAT repeat protein